MSHARLRLGFRHDDANRAVVEEVAAPAGTHCLMTVRSRRKEKPADERSGRGTIWLPPSVALAFYFSGSRPPTITKTWIDALLICSMSLAGLRAEDELPEKHDPVTTPPLP